MVGDTSIEISISSFTVHKNLDYVSTIVQGLEKFCIFPKLYSKSNPHLLSAP